MLVLGALLASGVSATAVGARADTPPRLVAATVPAPLGVPWQATYTDGEGVPARWDPCADIHYVVSGADLPRSAFADLDEALRRLSTASGLRFRYDGMVDELPSRGRGAYQPDRYGHRWAPVLVAWASPADTDLGIGDGTPGTSSLVAVAGRDGGSLVSGQVVLDLSRPLEPGFGPGATQGKVLLHELAHVLGLGHVADPEQLMHPRITQRPAVLGRGDREGLAALGAGGCHPSPAPRPVDGAAVTSSRRPD